MQEEEDNEDDNEEYKEEKVVEEEEKVVEEEEKVVEEEEKEIVMLSATGVLYHTSTIKWVKEVDAMRDQFEMLASTAKKKLFLGKKIVKWFERVLFMSKGIACDLARVKKFIINRFHKQHSVVRDSYTYQQYGYGLDYSKLVPSKSPAEIVQYMRQVGKNHLGESWTYHFIVDKISKVGCANNMKKKEE